MRKEIQVWSTRWEIPPTHSECQRSVYVYVLVFLFWWFKVSLVSNWTVVLIVRTVQTNRVANAIKSPTTIGVFHWTWITFSEGGGWTSNLNRRIRICRVLCDDQTDDESDLIHSITPWGQSRHLSERTEQCWSGVAYACCLIVLSLRGN